MGQELLALSESDRAKRAAGEAAAQRIRDGAIVGLGTGSTVVFFLDALGERVKRERLSLRGVATSEKTATHAASIGIEIVPLVPENAPELTVDGADEISPKMDLIKGAGGALVREKLVAQLSQQMLVIADSSKVVAQLGAFPLPVAVVPFAAASVIAQLHQMFEVPARLRAAADGSPLLTDDGLNILDLHFDVIRRPALLEKRLKILSGVVEVGLFVNLASSAIVGYPDGRVSELFPEDTR